MAPLFARTLVCALVGTAPAAAAASERPTLGLLCLRSPDPVIMEAACETLIDNPADAKAAGLSEAQLLYRRAAARNRLPKRDPADLERSLADLAMLRRKHGPHHLLAQESGRALAHLLRFDAAEAAYAEAERLGAAAASVPAHQRADYWAARSGTAFLAGRFEDALAFVDRSLAADRSGDPIDTFRLSILNALGRYGEAEDGASALLAKEPGNVSALLVRSEAYRMMRMFPFARRDLDAVERLDPDNEYLAEKRARLK